MKNRKEKIFLFGFCIFLGIVCIAVNSQNSFLYSFNENNDLHCFITTAKCMLRGDVLYRDVYEHKGPLLYFLYVIGLLIDSRSFLGIALIETVFYTIYILFVYKIAELYIDVKAWRYVVTILAAWISCSDTAFDGGGQCEELALPFLCITMYIVLKYFKTEYPRNIRPIDVSIIGFCFSCIFWMKYSLSGLYIGLVILIIIYQIKDKKVKMIWLYMFEFLIGFLAGTLPVIIYFLVNGGFEALFEVYFYKVIFEYGGGHYIKISFFDSFLLEDYLKEHILCAACYIAPVLYCIGRKEKHFTIQEKTAVITMIAAEVAGISASYYWFYTAECLCVFSVLGIIVVYNMIYDNRSKFGYCIRKVLHTVNSVATLGYEKIGYYALIVGGVIAVLHTEPYLYYVKLAIGILLARFLIKLEKAVKASLVRKKIIKYVLLIMVFFVPYTLIKTSGFIAAVILLVNDILNYKEWFVCNVKKIFSIIKNLYLNRILIRGMLYLCVMVIIAVYTIYISPSSVHINEDIERYPQYKIAEMINESGIDNPRIVYWDCFDLGIYWLTDTYPPYKYFCFYNLESDYIPDLYAEGLRDGSIDYVVTTKETLSGYDNYELIYYGERLYNRGYDRAYYLYKRK